MNERRNRRPILQVTATILITLTVPVAARDDGVLPQRRFLDPSVAEILQFWRQPPAVCSQAPFWFWNGPLDPNTMRRQIRLMADKGVRAAMPHPRFGMDRRLYLEEPFWNAMDAAVDEARKVGSSIWLYDEYNWPSGGAGGRVTDGHPEYYPRGLDYRLVECQGPRDFTVTRPEASEPVMERFERIVAGFIGSGHDAMPRRRWGQISSEGESISGPIPQGSHRILVFFRCLGRNPSPLDDGSNSFIDYLRPEATRRFIELTYEPYAKRYGGLFGKQIPAIFYDEPSTMAPAPLPWTFGFAEVFRQRRGFDLLAKLPALLDDSFPEAETVRAAYWQTVSERFNECFFDQIGRWCRAHGLPLTGHCYEENIAFYANSPHLMEQLRRVDWPGFDALGTRARPAAAKIPISVTHLEDREEVICEALGLAGGWNCTLDMLRGGYNQLACLGATTFIPHAFFQTVENPRVECPPSYFFQNPYWKYYDRLTALTDRLSLFNRLGRHVAPVLVYYPIESLWMDSAGGKGQRTFPWQHTTLGNDGARTTIDGFGSLVDGLFNHLWDLDVADGKALETARVVQTDAGARLLAGPERYRVLVFPPIRAVAPSALRSAIDFARAGGTVIWTGRLPDVCWPEAADPKSPRDVIRDLIASGTMTFFAQPAEVLENLPRLIDPEIVVTSGDGDGLLISHRSTASTDLYLCVNDSDDVLECRLRLPHRRGSAAAWRRLDTETGDVTSIQTTGTAENASVPLVLRAHASTVLLCTRHQSTNLACTVAEAPDDARPLSVIPNPQPCGPWTIQVVGDALDEVWTPTPGDTVVELPAFRHRARDFQRHPGWTQRDYNDSDWEQVYTVRDGALFVHTSPVLLRGALPPGAKGIETPLPITGEYALYINGIEREKRLGLVTKPDPLDMEGTADNVIALETTSHAGPAGLTGPLRVVCGPVRVDKLRPWSQWNLSWYTGRVLYRTTLKVPDAAQPLSTARSGQSPASTPRSVAGTAQDDGHTATRNDGRWFLDLGHVRHYVEVWLNGRLVGTRLWQPYRIDVTDHVRTGENELVLIVANSIANRFAWDQWGTRGTGRPEPSGLLGPVRLLRTRGEG
ncbi:MAG: hypothetical protein JW741_15815 [Sedimentisphaerales bacterium]|nr:hypothetical protein [Sedimentisphaerales bacterium]